MEDIQDNLPTEGKRYYNSTTEYDFTDKYLKELGEVFESKFKHELFVLGQLVCASNKDEARKAVIAQMDLSKNKLVLKCRIDNLIVGN